MKTSETFEKILHYPHDEISIRKLCDLLADKGFSFIILIMALPNVIPNVPGISSTTSVVIIFFSLQMIFGRKSLWLPEYVAKKKIPQKSLAKVIKHSLKPIKYTEKFLHERGRFLRNQWERIVGFAILILALVMLLPIPFMNFIVAIPICLLAIGFLAKDGFFIIFALIFSAAMLAVKYNLILAIIQKIVSYFL